jgi:hypothetical protein
MPIPGAPPPTTTAAPTASLPRWFFPAVAGVTTIGAVWGYGTQACGGVFIAAVWTVMMLGFLVLVDLPTLGGALLVFAASAVAALALAASGPLRERKELLLLLLPVIAFAAGLAVAMQGDLVGVKCAMGRWR